MKKTYLIALALGGLTLASACNSGSTRRNPGKIYAPDMVYSRAYDAYTENPVTRDGLTSQLPVEGTIARGQALPKHLTETDIDGYKALKFPTRLTDDQLKEGQRLFDIYCGICHGEKLDGQGPLFTSGKFASMPANLVAGTYYLNLEPGMIYHAIEYGKNMMGSYYSQLDEQQRWEVIGFIKEQQAAAQGIPFTYSVEDGSNGPVQVKEDNGTDSTANNGAPSQNKVAKK